MRCAIVGDNQAQKYLEVVGAGGSGKSSFMNIVTALVGARNCASTSLAAMEKDFGLAALVGKRLLCLPDQNDYRGEAAAFRSITGGDGLTVNPKHRDAYAYAFHAAVIMTGNQSLNPRDSGGAMERRRISIRMDTLPSKAEKAVYAKHGGIDGYIIKHELSGILAWVIGLSLDDARVRLNEKSEQIAAWDEETALDNKPVWRWFSEHMIKDESGEAKQEAMFTSYKFFTEDEGVSVCAKPKFAKEVISYLRTMGYCVTFTRTRVGAGGVQKQQVLKGWRLIQTA